jgi:hypothetical protein
MTSIIWKAAAALLLMAVFMRPQTALPQANCLSLSAPVDGEKVDLHPSVRGRACEKSATLYLIVHPMETPDYWVQAPIYAEENSTWSATAEIGRPGKLDIGKSFQLRAVSGVKGRQKESGLLKKGDILSGWPPADHRSAVITVIRK